MKIVEIIADSGHKDTLESIAYQYKVTDIWSSVENEEGRVVTRFLVPLTSRQLYISVWIIWLVILIFSTYLRVNSVGQNEID